jgi:hypothetical protein
MYTPTLNLLYSLVNQAGLLKLQLILHPSHSPEQLTAYLHQNFCIMFHGRLQSFIYASANLYGACDWKHFVWTYRMDFCAMAVVHVDVNAVFALIETLLGISVMSRWVWECMYLVVHYEKWFVGIWSVVLPFWLDNVRWPAVRVLSKVHSNTTQLWHECTTSRNVWPYF